MDYEFRKKLKMFLRIPEIIVFIFIIAVAIVVIVVAAIIIKPYRGSSMIRPKSDDREV